MHQDQNYAVQENYRGPEYFTGGCSKLGCSFETGVQLKLSKSHLFMTSILVVNSMSNKLWADEVLLPQIALWYIEAEIKWPPFGRHIQINFLE